MPTPRTAAEDFAILYLSHYLIHHVHGATAWRHVHTYTSRVSRRGTSAFVLYLSVNRHHSIKRMSGMIDDVWMWSPDHTDRTSRVTCTIPHSQHPLCAAAALASPRISTKDPARPQLGRGAYTYQLANPSPPPRCRCMEYALSRRLRRSPITRPARAAASPNTNPRCERRVRGPNSLSRARRRPCERCGSSSGGGGGGASRGSVAAIARRSICALSLSCACSDARRRDLAAAQHGAHRLASPADHCADDTPTPTSAPMATATATAATAASGTTATSAVRAIGSAKSNTRCLEAPGRLIRLESMTHIAVSADRTTATVGAGIVLRELADKLAAQGLQLYSIIEIGNITAGAMACAHTKNRHLPGEHGILSSYVCGVTLVDALGRVHKISEEAHVIDGRAADAAVWGAPAEMLRHVRTSHGLLGVLCDATLRVKPISGRSITHALYPSAKQFVTKCALQHAASGGSVLAYFSPYSDRFLVEVAKPSPLPPRGSWFWALREHFITIDCAPHRKGPIDRDHSPAGFPAHSSHQHHSPAGFPLTHPIRAKSLAWTACLLIAVRAPALPRPLFLGADPLLFRLGDALPTRLALALYAGLARVGEHALTLLHEHASAPPNAHIGWHDHASLTKARRQAQRAFLSQGASRLTASRLAQCLASALLSTLKRSHLPRARARTCAVSVDLSGLPPQLRRAPF